MTHFSRRSCPERWFVLLLLAVSTLAPRAQSGFTIDQALRSPYAVSISAAPAGARFAWVEVAEGRHNLCVGAVGVPARVLTHFTEDDGQELRELAWFADGKTLAFTRGTENGADGKPANATHQQPPPEIEVWTVDTSTPDAQPKLAGAGHAPLPMPDGRHLLLVRSGQIWIADQSADVAGPEPQTSSSNRSGDTGSPATKGSSMRQLVFDRGTASQMRLSPDGATLAFISHRDHNHSFLALFSLKSHILFFPAASTGNDSAPVFSPDGRKLAWLRAPWTDAPEFAANRASANPWSIQTLELATGSVHPAFVPTPNQPGSVLPHVSSGDPRLWWASGGQLIFASEADGWVHLSALEAAKPGSAPRLLTPGTFEVEDPAVSADGTRLVYAANSVAGDGNVHRNDPRDSDRRHLWSLDLTQPSAKPQQLTAGDGLETHPTFAADGTAVAALQSGVRTPNHAVIVAPTGTVSALSTAPASEQVAQANFVTPEQVLFPAADKLFMLHGQLFVPAASKSDSKTPARRPAILFFHGGPRRQMLLGYPAMEYYARAYALNQYFVSRGFIVLSVNYRRGIGYGLDFREAAHSGADGAAEYSDVLGAAAYLRSRPDVDSTRIGLWGGSYGGYLTALGLARNSDLFAAGVDFHGVHDWILEDNRSDWLRGTAADQSAIADLAHRSSPLADVERWKSPVLLHPRRQRCQRGLCANRSPERCAAGSRGSRQKS